MNNYNISVRNNQAFSQSPLDIAYWLGGSTPASYVPQILSRRRYTPIRIKMIQFVLRQINNHEFAFPSHESIADFAGCKRLAVIEAFKDFEEDSLFEIDHRGDKRLTNIYKLGSIFRNREVIYALRDIFKNLYRAFCRTLDWAYNGVVKRNEIRNSRVDHTLTTNVVVFICINTNTTTFNNRKKENNLVPYLKKENWLNKMKAMWADWSLTEKDWVQKPLKQGKRELKVSDQDLLFDVEAQEEIRKDRKYQQFKRNDAKYPTYYNNMTQWAAHKTVESVQQYQDRSKRIGYGKLEQDPKETEQTITVQQGPVMQSAEFDKLERQAANEPNLHTRIALYKDLLLKCDRASQPFVKILIQKTSKKIQQSYDTPF